MFQLRVDNAPAQKVMDSRVVHGGDPEVDNLNAESPGRSLG